MIRLFTKLRMMLMWSIITFGINLALKSNSVNSLNLSSNRLLEQTRSRERFKTTTVLKKTKVSDLESVSSILAHESSNLSNNGGSLSFNDSIKQLRARSSFLNQLTKRLKATEEAYRVLAEIDLKDEPYRSGSSVNKILPTTINICKILWKDKQFRGKLERAVHAISLIERTGWEGHNFSQLPDLPLLNHVMISAQDITNSNIVGFFEIAMLPVFLTKDGSDGKVEELTPCIMNLVVSPEHRRKGIASRMVRCAIRYTETHWTDNDLGLFVYKENKGAIALYEKEGFEVQGSSHEHPDKLYLKYVR